MGLAFGRLSQGVSKSDGLHSTRTGALCPMTCVLGQVDRPVSYLGDGAVQRNLMTIPGAWAALPQAVCAPRCNLLDERPLRPGHVAAVNDHSGPIRSLP